ncbi:hypothetical protein OHA21_12810 [Actinoplanes sp. NBC_00393]|uniref:hypothetical protein n=1 Tax=Actinoplanes sp. NBC_00393 TaxID=2975953 RepID=UPI002E239CF6
MTPEQHAARAEALAADAERQFEVVQRGIDSNDVNPADVRLLSAIAQLGQLHASLALRPARGWPSPVPATDVVDYGDGFPQ